MTPGIYLAHKPVGQTSFSLVQGFMEEVRAAGIRRDRLPVCHGGVLDPFAEGLVLLLAGPATRLMDLLHPVPKAYLAEIAWGMETDNGDLLGQMTKKADAGILTAALLDEALAEFLGWRDQVPPAHSNKRIGGERAYLRAQRGEIVDLPPSRVYLHEARFLSHDLPRRSTLRIVSGGGYYVRALARDLGRRTGALGHLTKLHRTAIGPWEDPGPGRRVQLRGAQLYPWCRSREITAAEWETLRDARPIEPDRIVPAEWKLPQGFPDPDAPIRALLGGSIVAMLRERDGALHAAPFLKPPL